MKKEHSFLIEISEINVESRLAWSILTPLAIAEDYISKKLVWICFFPCRHTSQKLSDRTKARSDFYSCCDDGCAQEILTYESMWDAQRKRLLLLIRRAFVRCQKRGIQQMLTPSKRATSRLTIWKRKRNPASLGTEKSKEKFIESDVNELESKLTLWRPNEKQKRKENATSQANSITLKWKNYIEYDQ